MARAGPAAPVATRTGAISSGISGLQSTRARSGPGKKSTGTTNPESSQSTGKTSMNSDR